MKLTSGASLVLAVAAVLALLLACLLVHGAEARDLQKRNSGKGGGNQKAKEATTPSPTSLAALQDDKDDKCVCSCGLCYTKPEWRPPAQPNCTTFCIYRVKHYEPCFSGDICAPLDFVPVYDYYQIQIPSKVRGWNPQLMNGRLLTSTTTTEEPPVREADNCEFLELLNDAKIAI